jgi:hypothetical protein
MAGLFFGNPAVRADALTRGFASQPHGWFAFIGRVSPVEEQDMGQAADRRATRSYVSIGVGPLAVSCPETLPQMATKPSPAPLL